MKRIETISAPGQSLSLTLPFAVEHIAAFNPTIYTLGFRLGGRDVPNELDDTDIYIPPGSTAVFPVIGVDFAAGFMEPLAPFQPESLPTRAKILFVSGEMPPSFSAITPLNVPATTEVIQSFFDGEAGASTPALTEYYRYTALSGRVTRIRNIFISVNTTPGAGQLIVFVTINNNFNVQTHMIARIPSLASPAPDIAQYIRVEIELPVNWSLVMQAGNAVASDQNILLYPYIETELYV